MNFQDLASHSKVWVYQSDREFTSEEVINLKTTIDSFLKEWAAHGKSLKGAVDIFYNRFIVIGVDQEYESASGCSIDSLTRFIQQLEKEFSISLLNRTQVAFKSVSNIETTSLSDFQKLLNEGMINEETIVFNNLVATKEEFLKNWEVPVKESWHRQFV